MSRFNAGDRVRAIGNVSGFEGPGTVLEVDEGHPTNEYLVRFDSRPGNRIWAENDSVRPLLVASIHITTDGKTTHAVLKEGGKVTKRAKAVCSPHDEFDFETGARIAFGRLVGNPAGVVPGTSGETHCAEYKVGDYAMVVTERPSAGYGHHFEKHDLVEILQVSEDKPEIRCKGMASCKKYLQTLKPSDLSPVREVKRPAKVGEWVKVVDARGVPHSGGAPEYKNGDILRVIKSNRWARYANGSAGDGRERVLNSGEYVVLEGYTPEPEKPTYYNGKVVCVDDCGRPEAWTKGRVYVFVDGVTTSDKGRKTFCYKTLEHANGEKGGFWVGAKFIEFKGEA